MICPYRYNLSGSGSEEACGASRVLSLSRRLSPRLIESIGLGTPEVPPVEGLGRSNEHGYAEQTRSQANSRGRSAPSAGSTIVHVAQICEVTREPAKGASGFIHPAGHQLGSPAKHTVDPSPAATHSADGANPANAGPAMHQHRGTKQSPQTWVRHAPVLAQRT